MKPFAFVGRIHASKSILNRLLLVQSYSTEVRVIGDSDADDVSLMKQGLANLGIGEQIDCGAAGTVFRFLALRASRIPGKHLLVGTPRLMARPHEELLRIFRQLGVTAEFTSKGFEIESEGWRPQGDTLQVSGRESSQFLSGVLLNAWNLPFDLYVSTGGGRVSEGYWKMSQALAQKLGMKIDFWDGDFRVSRAQKPSDITMTAEIDMSSAFALAAVAAVNGKITLTDFPDQSLQPDSIFVTVLRAMGVNAAVTHGQLRVEKAPRLNGIAFDLKSAPDLFPVLAALCALAHGDSDLFGAPHLVHKESNRIEQIGKLLSMTGRQFEITEGGVKIFGPVMPIAEDLREVDPADDHRMAFAAAVLQAAGYRLKIKNPEVVAKSFPEFWSLLGWSP